jgi:hypothetical protein
MGSIVIARGYGTRDDAHGRHPEPEGADIDFCTAAAASTWETS